MSKMKRTMQSVTVMCRSVHSCMHTFTYIRTYIIHACHAHSQTDHTTTDRDIERQTDRQVVPNLSKFDFTKS
jgi:hypothetical protein